MNTLRCDILILGAGPAGMAAALSAAAGKVDVLIHQARKGRQAASVQHGHAGQVGG